MNEELSRYIQQMADQLGVAATHVYGILVKQAFVNGVVWTAVDVVVIAAIVTAFIVLGKATVRNWDHIIYENCEAYAVVGWVFGGLVGLIILVIAVINLPDAVMAMFNPEYYAIKTILEAIK